MRRLQRKTEEAWDHHLCAQLWSGGSDVCADNCGLGYGLGGGLGLALVIVLVVVVANQLQLMWIVQQCSAFEEQPPMEGTARAASFSWKCQQLFNPLLLNPTKTLCFGNSMYNGNMKVGKNISWILSNYPTNFFFFDSHLDQTPMTPAPLKHTKMAKHGRLVNIPNWSKGAQKGPKWST